MAGSPPDASDGLLNALQALIFNGTRQLTERQRKRIYQNLTDTTIANIVAAVPSDAILDEGRPIDFKMASPGQQASALLEDGRDTFDLRSRKYRFELQPEVLPSEA